MAKNKLTIQFKEFEELAEKFQALDGDLKQATENALKASKAVITRHAASAIRKHKRTGSTEASLDRSMKVNWEGTYAELKIGFSIRNGGLPSIFLMYGTPRMQKDQALYDAIYGSKVKRQIAKAQKEVFEKMIARRMGDG